MANPEHLQILKQGVEAWNAWRKQNEDIRPDLTSTDLSGTDLTSVDLGEGNLASANLSGAILSGATLVGAYLVEANLSSATLSGASLNWAHLVKADLTRANLSGATFAGTTLVMADLSEANLSKATFTGANLSRATLRGADLSEAVFIETVFGETNLTAVQGLETCHHSGPSTLDHRTITGSGPLPMAFLRGCGLPDVLIDSLYSLLDEPMQVYCFISHASKDHAFAKRVYADRQNNGVRCWFAPEDLPIGAKTRVSIDETIRVCDKLLLILSKHSVASQWVEQEVETALARERQQGTTILFPVRIDNTVMTLETGWPALIRNTRNIGDFRRWKTHNVYQQAFDRLLRDLKAAARPPEG